jgi:uncharacterized membrane protein
MDGSGSTSGRAGATATREDAAAPRVAGSRRLIGVDAARGLALLGMMVVHVLPSTDDAGDTTTPYLLAGGRSAAAFAVLAGVGLALASGGRRPHTGARRGGDRLALLVRAAAIGCIGLLLGSLDSGVAVILPYYALLFVVAAAFLWLRPAAAALTALVVAVTLPVVGMLVRPELPERDVSSPTFADLLETPGRLLSTLTFTGYYPVLAWTAYLCAGIAVGRLALDSTRVAAALLCGGAALALGASAVSELLLGPLGGLDELAATSGWPPAELHEQLERSQFGNVPTDSWWWLAVDSPHSTTPFDLLGTIGTALAVIGGMLLLARVAGPALVSLAAAGSMTLTLYTAHVWALSGDWLPSDPEMSWLLQAVAALALATVWRRFVGRGPLEAVIAAAARRVRGAVESTTR